MSFVRGTPLKYSDPSGHFPWLVVVAAVAVTLKVIDYGWTAYDAYQSTQVLSDPNASSSEQALAAANLAATVAFEAAEPDDLLPVALPLDDLARHSDEIAGYIFKSGPDTAKNLTPRPGIDDVDMNGGLSFFDDPSKLGLDPGDKYTIVDPGKIDGLDIVPDNNPPGHVSVRPSTLEELRGWASTRGTEVVHQFTTSLQQAVVDVKKWMR